MFQNGRASRPYVSGGLNHGFEIGPRLTLVAVGPRVGAVNSGFFSGPVTDDGGADPRLYTGRWGGQFFGNGEPDGTPGSVAGTFGARTTDFPGGNVGEELSIVGAFGAHKQ
ncbi:MAG: hypothetical protein OXE53_00365 [Deltaproteobacteria bacterium]|nr:hypothetical protein [Deltaproteobacteria bacterium]